MNDPINSNNNLPYKLAFVKPNHKNYSETFLENQIRLLDNPKRILYGGAFPTREDDGSLLIKNPFHLLLYFYYKKVLRRTDIPIRDLYLKKWLLKNKISVVLAQYGPTGALIAPACKMASIPLVIHFHGYDAYDQGTLKKYGKLYPFALDFASKIVSVSNEMVARLIELGASKEKVYFISCGVDTQYFSNAKPALSKRIFLSVARFAEKKSPFSTIRAFKLVVEKYPDSKLIMAGIGPLWEASKTLALDLNISNNIEFKGVQTPAEVLNLIRKSRAFVQHSVTAPSGDKEGTPTSLLEASSSGLPIISTCHAGIKDAVIHEKTGFLVQEGDIESMAKFMLLLAGDSELSQQMGENGREHMENNYDLKIQIKKLNNLLYEAMNEQFGLKK